MSVLGPQRLAAEALGQTEATFMRVVGLSAAVAGLTYAGVCIGGRSSSVWPLEWMEGASVVHAQRLLSGLPLYAAPQSDFIPFVYPPLSYLPMGLGLVLSSGALWGARIASVFAFALCCFALARAAKHASGSAAAGWLAAGLFAFGYGYTGAFIDLARVDAWFCALSLCGVERLCARRYTPGLVLLALSCFAKQHAVLLLAAASGGVLLVQGRRAVPGVVAAWFGLAICAAALYAWSDGWIWTYCITVPARHGVRASLLASFVLVDLCVYLPLLVGLCAYSIARRRGPDALLLHLLLAAAVAASALGRAHPGGDDNVRLPAYALVVLVAAISLMQLLQERWRWPLLAALALQLGMLFQPPALYWPTPQTAATFRQLKAALTRCAGSNDYVAMDHSHFGGQPFVHTLALSDLRMNHDNLADQATQAVLSRLGSELPVGPIPDAGQGGKHQIPTRSPPRAIAISSAFPALMRTLADHYELCSQIPPTSMPSGYRVPATYIYRHAPQ